MATTETTDRFRSNLRKEQNRSGGTRDRRRVFEDGGGGGGNTYSTPGATSRYSRSTHDRTESPSSGKTTTSITSTINKLSMNDDCKDDDEDDREERKEDEEQSPSKKQPKKFSGTSGSSSLANKINKLSMNDDEGDVDDDSEDKKEEEERAPRKQLKKSGTKNTGQKRKERKNLREKRRSTGVVIMPGPNPGGAGDDEERQVQENTAKNMGECEPGAVAASSGASGAEMEAEAKRNKQYIEELQDELAKAHRDLDQLRSDNLRLKVENSALLRVVGSLSGTGCK